MSDAPRLVIRGGSALVGRDLDPLPNALIAIHGERIASIETDLGAASVDGAAVVDATHLTLLPGFIDAHVHIGFFDPADLLMGGVTTVRDLGWPPDEIFRLAERSRDPLFSGPDIVAAGPMLTVKRGYPTRAAWAPPGTGRVVTSPDDAADAVRQIAERGASVVKVALNAAVGPTLDLPTLTAIVDAAHERGLKTTGHVYGLGELEKALDAGLDELAHMLMSEERIPDEVIDRMVGQQMTVVPTLSIRFGQDRALAIENLARFRAAGGHVVYGTDLGNEGPRPGIDPTEVRAMAAAGFSGVDIVRSATVDSAAWLGLHRKGALAADADADVIGVAGDPVTDPSCLADVRLVVRRGRVVKEP